MHRDDAKPLIWSAVGGAVVTMVVGFAWGGWMTSGSAAELANKASMDAVVERLAPICVSLATKDPEHGAKMTTLGGTDAWRRGGAVATFGWATMPGEKQPDQKVADRCAELAIPAAK